MNEAEKPPERYDSYIMYVSNRLMQKLVRRGDVGSLNVIVHDSELGCLDVVMNMVRGEVRDALDKCSSNYGDDFDCICRVVDEVMRERGSRERKILNVCNEAYELGWRDEFELVRRAVDEGDASAKRQLPGEECEPSDGFESQGPGSASARRELLEGLSHADGGLDVSDLVRFGVTRLEISFEDCSYLVGDLMLRAGKFGEAAYTQVMALQCQEQSGSVKGNGAVLDKIENLRIVVVLLFDDRWDNLWAKKDLCEKSLDFIVSRGVTEVGDGAVDNVLDQLFKWWNLNER